MKPTWMHTLMMTSAAIAAMAMAMLAAAPAGAQEAPAAMDGKALFLKHCAACHQASGKGIPGAFPALAGNSFVQGKATDPAAVLLKGRGGMPDFSDSLSDRDIATVLSYVRNAWGNHADTLTEAEVQTLRSALGVDPYGGGVMSNKH